MPETIDIIINFITDPTITGKFVFGTKSTQSEDKTDLSYTPFENEVRNGFRTDFLNHIKKFQKLPVAKYSATDFDPDSYFTIKIKEVPDSKQIIREPDNPIAGLEHQFINNVKFIAVHFQNSSQKKVIFFKVYPKTRFLRKNKMDAIVFRENILSFSKNDIMVIDHHVDCVVYGDEILIFNTNAFEKIFNYRKIYAENLENVFNYFESNKPDYKIEKLNELKDQCNNDLRKLRKITGVYEKELYKKLDLNKVRKFVTAYQIQDVIVDLQKKTITFKDAHSFLHFYNDDNLKSELTDEKYLSYLKKPVG